MRFRSFTSIFAIISLGGGLTYAFIYYGDLASLAFKESDDRDPASEEQKVSSRGSTKNVLDSNHLTKTNADILVDLPGIGRVPVSKANRLRKWVLELGLGNKGVRRITKMDYVEAKFLKNPWDSSQQFLDEYSDYLFRVERSQLTVRHTQEGEQEDELKKIVYEQTIDGIPVENSRMAFFYLPDGTLYEVQASVAEVGDIPSSRSPEITALEAGTIASSAISRRYRRAGQPLPANYAPSVFAKRAEFRFFLSPSGVVTKRYHFTYIVQPAPGLDPGEYAIAVDTVTRTVASDRKISKR